MSAVKLEISKSHSPLSALSPPSLRTRRGTGGHVFKSGLPAATRIVGQSIPRPASRPHGRYLPQLSLSPRAGSRAAGNPSSGKAPAGHIRFGTGSGNRGRAIGIQAVAPFGGLGYKIALQSPQLVQQLNSARDARQRPGTSRSKRTIHSMQQVSRERGGGASRRQAAAQAQFKISGFFKN